QLRGPQAVPLRVQQQQRVHVLALQQVGGAARGGTAEALGHSHGPVVDLVAPGADLELPAQAAEGRPVLPAPARPQAEHTYAQRVRHRSSVLGPWERLASPVPAGPFYCTLTGGAGQRRGLLLPSPRGGEGLG